MNNVYKSALKVLLPKPATVKFLTDFSKSIVAVHSKSGVFILSKN